MCPYLHTFTQRVGGQTGQNAKMYSIDHNLKGCRYMVGCMKRSVCKNMDWDEVVEPAGAGQMGG